MITDPQEKGQDAAVLPTGVSSSSKHHLSAQPEPDLDAHSTMSAGPPPAYDDDPPPPHSAEQLAAQLNVRPCNFVAIEKVHDSVKGTFLLDPTLVIPSAVLAPLPEDASERDHLRFTSTHGSIAVDVYAAAGSAATELVPTTILARSTHGSVTLRLHEIIGCKVAVMASSKHGSVNVFVPRSFRGPVTCRTKHGSVRFADAMTGSVTVFSDVDHTLQGFVGDHAGWSGDRKDWTGDELTLDSVHGSIKVNYIEAPTQPGGKGFWSKLLGG